MRVPAGVVRELRRGLRLWEELRAGPGLQPETIARAIAWTRGAPATEADVRRVRAWHRRHGASWREVDARLRQAAELRAGQLRGRAPALTAWLLWGGAAGERWAESAATRAPSKI